MLLEPISRASLDFTFDYQSQGYVLESRSANYFDKHTSKSWGNNAQHFVNNA
jgi:hypothetical protein